MINPLITVITVCYNAENTIVETLNNILDQDYDNLEMVLIDGNSTDKTMKLVEKNIYKFNEKGINIIWKSERDNGIQDAYNKAMKIAHGEWLIFINSGDKINSTDVFKIFAKQIASNDAEVVYGDIMLQDYRSGETHKRSYAEKLDLNFFMKTTLCHQAVFFKKRLFDCYGEYDLSFKIASDFDRLLVFYLRGARFSRIPIVVGFFVNDGVSSTSYKKMYMERMAIISKRVGNIPTYWRIYHLLHIFKEFISQTYLNYSNTK